MTPEDLNQIRAVLREDFRAVVREELDERLASAVASIRKELDERLTSAVVAIRQEFAERLGAAVVSLSTDFSELRQEMIRRFDESSRRMDALERRMDRVAETNADIVSQLAALTRWANRLDRDNGELHNTQIAQQRVIEDLAKRAIRPPAQPPS